jgi:hypothetical protein
LRRVDNVAQAWEQGDQPLSGDLQEHAEEAGLDRLLRSGRGREAGCRKPQESEADDQDNGFLKISFPHSGLLLCKARLGKKTEERTGTEETANQVLSSKIHPRLI